MLNVLAQMAPFLTLRCSRADCSIHICKLTVDRARVLEEYIVYRVLPELLAIPQSRNSGEYQT
jgi:hypothetical protein